MSTSDERWADLGIPKRPAASLDNPVAGPDLVQAAIDLVLLEMANLQPPTPYDKTNDDRELCVSVAAAALHTLVVLLRKEHDERSTTARDH